ncbi:MAG: phosphodiester glycosidase family protein [Eubacteriales bacterium]|nr:phosphodiester glycosidase family protein [Eubacteriales bacterium]
MGFIKKPFRWAIVYSLVLLLASAYVLLDTFVIPRALVAAVGDLSVGVSATAEADTATKQADNASAVTTDTSYEDENIKITLETVYVDDTEVYIADIQLSDASYLKTAFANGIYGRNIKATTSAMAESNDAVFAINGDYYGFRSDGYVIRNGTLYRDTSGDNEDLVIDSDGNFSIIEESETTARSLMDAGAWQVLSFGPALINNGEITVLAGSEVGQSKSSNPRTAIGQVSTLHYIVIVSDGRTTESAGLSLLELAQLFEERGCQVAYNLDGGGSATMWFNGRVVNNPTDGRTLGERSVSDIVYFGN